MNKFSVVTFYQFKKQNNVPCLKEQFNKFCFLNKIRGTILISPEGVNGTIAGSSDAIKLFEKHLQKLGFDDYQPKFSTAKFMPFPRLKIKSKEEIVTFQEENLNIEVNKGKYVDPSDWNKLLEDDDTILIDVRNNFEVEIGAFENAENLKLVSFTDFKDYAKKNLLEIKDKKIAMYCTGGIRCEKASAYLVKNGIKDVYQLRGGILKYLEEIDDKNSKWKGECFVFDSRVSVKHGLDEGEYIICGGCRNPVPEIKQYSEEFEFGVSCENCFSKTTEEKKENLRERVRQTKIAEKKNLKNPFLKISADDYFKSGI